jgi:hypothetical protein
MSKYNTFLTLFIVTAVAAVLFFFFYIQAIFGFAFQDEMYPRDHTDPFEIFSTIFSPQVIISFLLLAAGSLAYRIYGIVLVAKNKQVSDGEKALWIVGFVIMGFITAIVFLVMGKGKGFTAQVQQY